MRRLYLLVMEAERGAATELEDVEAYVMNAWAASDMPYQIRAIRPGGILALKVLEELPPLRRGQRDRPAELDPELEIDRAATRALEAGLDTSTPVASEPAQGVMPLD